MDKIRAEVATRAVANRERMEKALERDYWRELDYGGNRDAEWALDLPEEWERSL